MNKLDVEKLNKLSSELEDLNLNKDLGELADILYETIKTISKTEVKDGEKGDRGEQGIPGKNGLDGKDGVDGVNGKDGLNGADGSPDTPEIIKEKLDSIDYLDELKKELDKMKKRLDSQPIRGGGAGPTGGHVVKVYDISASLDGLTKTFSLPAFWRVISVQSSSLPFAFRPIIDYTVDGSAMTITFTSEIVAGTTLSAGQTVTIIYSE